jgi:hypothetical protein
MLVVSVPAEDFFQARLLEGLPAVIAGDQIGGEFLV